MFLARKIGRAKWVSREGLEEGEISADVVTRDLKTQDNKLSFWKCRTEADGDVAEVVLAIAAAGDRIGAFDIVLLPEGELHTDGQTLEKSRGRTAVSELADRHVDVCKLDYVRLGKIACRVVAAIDDKRCHRFRKKRVRKLLIAAAKKNRIDRKQLSKTMRKEIPE